MIDEQGKQALWTLLGVSTGVVAGVWLWRRWSRPAPVGAPDEWTRPRGSSADVVEAFRRDPALSRSAVDVEAVSEGVVELSGSVPTRDEAERAVRLAQSSRGVYTVVNRLTVDEEEAHRSEAARRRETGAPELSERGHTGMGVGMETRRQSSDTDPDRPSDKQAMLDRELDVGNIVDEPGSGPAPISGAEAVESDRVKPGDEEAIREAGLDASPRPTSTPEVARDEDAAEPSATDAEDVAPEEEPERS